MPRGSKLHHVAILCLAACAGEARGVNVAAALGAHESFEAGTGPSADASMLATRLFDEFVSKHGRSYTVGTQEYQERKSIFESRLAMVQRHNQNAKKLWKAGINKLSDMTDAELAKLRGYKRSMRSGARMSAAASVSAPFGLMGAASSNTISSSFPTDFTWARKLNATSTVLDQGRCGSCWAFASVATLNAHSELFGDGNEFSPQQLVSCAPNPRQCGGSGGCEGSTVELAFDYLLQSTAVSADSFKYVAADVPCPSELQLNSSAPHSGLHGADSPSPEEFFLASASGKKTLGLVGWTALPENKAKPFFQTLYEMGPIAVALAAYSRWNLYVSGILDSCGGFEEDKQAFIVNHAAVLIGWGYDAVVSQPYWHIQNSWGADWGEDGFMRILRQEGVHNEETLCAVDDDPLVGVGCPDGPGSIEVCGSCGMLYDGLIPSFQGSLTSWWARHGHQLLDQGNSLLRGAA